MYLQITTGSNLEEKMAAHPIVLAWSISWTEVSPWGLKESDVTERLSSHTLGMLVKDAPQSLWDYGE